MVTSGNSVEDNYKNFYTLHAKYQLGTFTDADSSALLQLANLCPGLDGEVVYQARALYNVNYKTVIRYVENCNPLTQNNLRILNKIVNKNANEWLIELFPNPANTFVNIVSTHEKDNLSVCIMDVSGKVLFVKEATTNNFICKLELDLLPGAYIVTITNDKNNTTNKKLIITK